MKIDLFRTLPLSRAESVFVGGLILVVCALAIPGAFALRQARRKAAAREEIRALLEAGHRFYGEYGVWPTAQMGEYGDVRYGRRQPNVTVMNVLRGLDGLGNEGHAVNPERISFFDSDPARPGRLGFDPEGNYLDPWGAQYQVVLDTDLDGNCSIETSIHGAQSGAGFLVWSLGPDGISDTADDLLSWDGDWE